MFCTGHLIDWIWKCWNLLFQFCHLIGFHCLGDPGFSKHTVILSGMLVSGKCFKVAPKSNNLWHCVCKCYVLNAVFAFAFTPSPLKLITCNKQWLNSVLLSSLLKFWDLVLNNKCPNKSVFNCFYGFICDFHEFPSVKSSKIFTSHRFQRDTNFKQEKSRGCKGSFFDIFKFMSFTAAKNLVL